MKRDDRRRRSDGLGAFVRRNRHGLWALGFVLTLASMAGLWILGVGLEGVDRTVRAWERSWIAKLARAEEVVAEGRYEDASALLEELDRRFPATWVKHKFAPQRERILELRSEHHFALGRDELGLEALERLAKFDDRNWRNHFLLAEACRRLGKVDRALAAYDEVLALHPSHLATVEALVALALERRDHARAAALFERYLDGYVLARMPLRVGGNEYVLEIPVDGREHTVELPVNLGDTAIGGDGGLRLETDGHSVRVRSIELVEPARVGVARSPNVRVLAGDAGWTGESMTSVDASSGDAPPGASTGTSTWAALDGESALRLSVASETWSSVARIRATLTAYKGVSEELWSRTSASYEQVDDLDGLERARARTVVGGWREAGREFGTTPRGAVR